MRLNHFSKIVKEYIKNELKVYLNDFDYYHIHRIGLKKKKLILISTNNYIAYSLEIFHLECKFIEQENAKARLLVGEVRLDKTLFRSS